MLIIDIGDAIIPSLNLRVRDKIGLELFHRFPLGPAPPGLEKALRRRGWREITIKPLDPSAGAEDEFPESWFLVEVVR